MASLKGDDGVPSGFGPSAGFGVWGDSGSAKGAGVVGSGTFNGVEGRTLQDHPIGPTAAGVYGSGWVAVAGYAIGSTDPPPYGGIGLYGSAQIKQGYGGTGVLGTGDNAGVVGWGLKVGVEGVGYGDLGVGVIGGTDSANDGVQGYSRTGNGVFGSSRSCGVRGIATASSGTGVFGVAREENSVGVIAVGGRRAAVLNGDVDITGHLTKGGGGFAIDHPLDLEKRYLNHSFVESPQRKNLYDGIASCDGQGEAIVDLPAWFEPLNEDLRYQLTAIGAPAPKLHVASEVERGRFKIAGGAPGLRVSWLVTGVRRDAWAKAHPLIVEEDKAPADQGFFLHSKEHGHTLERDIHRRHYEEADASLRRAEELMDPQRAKKGGP